MYLYIRNVRFKETISDLAAVIRVFICKLLFSLYLFNRYL